MERNYYQEFVNAMRERLPSGVNLAAELMEILCLGKESVYRRLRGDVAFTFDEIVYLSKHFNISLDSVLGDRFSNGAMFNLQLLQSHVEIQNYEDMMNYYNNIFSYIAKDPDSELCLASNTLSFFCHPIFKELTQYRLCRYLYQNDKLLPPCSLSDIDMPVSVIELQKKLASAIQQIGRVSFIWDSNVIISLVKEILYFGGLQVISNEDVMALKEELLRLIDELEKLTLKGCSDMGNPISIYLSNLNFDMSYGYSERSGFHISFFRAYSINSIDSQQKIICETQKKWINSLKRHSTLITQSGEAERIRFFNEQRAAVKAMKLDKAEQMFMLY